MNKSASNSNWNQKYFKSEIILAGGYSDELMQFTSLKDSELVPHISSHMHGLGSQSFRSGLVNFFYDIEKAFILDIDLTEITEDNDNNPTIRSNYIYLLHSLYMHGMQLSNSKSVNLQNLKGNLERSILADPIVNKNEVSNSYNLSSHGILCSSYFPLFKPFTKNGKLPTFSTIGLDIINKYFSKTKNIHSEIIEEAKNKNFGHYTHIIDEIDKRFLKFGKILDDEELEKLAHKQILIHYGANIKTEELDGEKEYRDWEKFNYDLNIKGFKNEHNNKGYLKDNLEFSNGIISEYEYQT
jgi:hypothetical protein